MRWQPLRAVTALAALAGSFFALDYFEKRRAVNPPLGWSRVTGSPTSVSDQGPAVLTSAWRVGPETRWSSDTEATQVYIRPELRGPIGLSLAATQETGTWIWISEDRPVTASRGDVVVDCMGSIATTSAVAPFALTEQDGSILVTWGEQRMVCPVELADDRAQGGRPGLRTTVSGVRLRSIGRNKHTDGVPLSPLWWMSGLMVGGLLGMLSLDLLLSILARIRPARVRSEE